MYVYDHLIVKLLSSVPSTEKMCVCMCTQKRSAAACAFIDHEAELSDDGAGDVSDDEVDNSQMDSMLQDFIHDGSQVFQSSQADGTAHTGMAGFCMKHEQVFVGSCVTAEIACISVSTSTGSY